MPRKRDFFHTGLNVSRSDLAGYPFSMYGKNPTGAQDYFMDLNVAVNGDGSSWDDPVNTVAAALLLADNSIGLSTNRWWARRNRVFVCGDGITETLVLAAEKTDLIGVGYDVGSFPKITGNFTIGTAVNGFRIFNMGFIPITTAPGITFPAGMYGWELHKVTVYKVEGVLNSASILAAGASREWRMTSCRVLPDAGGVRNTLGVSFVGDAGDGLMDDCFIEAAEGVKVAGAAEGTMLKNSHIIATALCLNDDGNEVNCSNMNFISAAASGDGVAVGCLDWNPALAANCYLQAAATMGPIPNLAAHV